MNKTFIWGSILGFVATFSILYFYKIHEKFTLYDPEKNFDIKKFNKDFQKKVYGITDQDYVIPNDIPLDDFDIEEFNKKFTLDNTIKQPLPSNADIVLVNSTDNATGRATQDSIPINNQIKYKNAFYYEYDNDEYMKKLNIIFNVRRIFNEGEWYTYNLNDNTPDDILSSYNKCINILTKRLNNNNTLLLPNEKKVQIQIVHDVLLKYYRNRDSTDLFAYNIELVLYRESKYQGKHIALRIVYNKKYETLFVTDLKIIGVVPEDKIGMFPIVATDPYDINELSTKNSSYPEIIPEENYSIINDKSSTGYWQVTGFDQDTINTLKKRARLNIMEEAANNAILPRSE